MGKTGNVTGINLQSEIAFCKTVGVVLRPRWVSKLNISVDCIDIALKNAIETLIPVMESRPRPAQTQAEIDWPVALMAETDLLRVLLAGLIWAICVSLSAWRNVGRDLNCAAIRSKRTTR